MKNKRLKSKIDKNIRILKTLQKKSPKILKDVALVREEQKKYQDFLTKQSKGKYAYIETQSFSTI